MKPKQILLVCGGCIWLLAFCWLALQVNQLKVEARSLAAELEHGREISLPGLAKPTPQVMQVLPQAVALPPAEPIEIADIMTKLQRHMNKLYFAGENQNWDLAAFYLEEVEETVKGVANKNIMEGQVNVSGLMQGVLVPDI